MTISHFSPSMHRELQVIKSKEFFQSPGQTKLVKRDWVLKNVIFGLNRKLKDTDGIIKRLAIKHFMGDER